MPSGWRCRALGTTPSAFAPRVRGLQPGIPSGICDDQRSLRAPSPISTLPHPHQSNGPAKKVNTHDQLHSTGNKVERTSVACGVYLGLFPRVYKFVNDLHFYVTGAVDENEIILATVGL